MTTCITWVLVTWWKHRPCKGTEINFLLLYLNKGYKWKEIVENKIICLAYILLTKIVYTTIGKYAWCYWWWGEGEGVSNVENGGSFTKFTFPLYSSKLTSSEVWWHSPERGKDFSGAKDKPWAMIWSQGQQPACSRNGHVNSVGSQVSLDLGKGEIGHNNPVCDMIWTFYTTPLSFLENLPSQFFMSPFLWVFISQVLLLMGG